MSAAEPTFMSGQLAGCVMRRNRRPSGCVPLCCVT